MNRLERRIRFVQSYLENAKERILIAEYSKNRGFHHNAVRLAQEAVELCIKAILRLYGLEYPKTHDVGPVLKEHQPLFPKWFREIIPQIAKISRQLGLNRGPAMYGNEEAEIPPNELYDEEDAKEAINKARKVLEYCTKLFKEWIQEKEA